MMQHKEGAKVQDESLRSWQARGRDRKEKTKKHELTLEKLVSKDRHQQPGVEKRRKGVGCTDVCEVEARDVEMDIANGRNSPPEPGEN